MSSNYHAICLSHDPALILGGLADGSRDHAAALAYGRQEHPRCVLLIGRWSGGLVGVCCPGQAAYPPEHPAPPTHSGWHRDDQWIEASWLRLLALSDETMRAKAGRTDCWTYDTARRLWVVLGLAEAG